MASEHYRTLLLFGAPGVGKGTQGKMLGSRPGLHHLSSGDVFRSLDPESEMGRTFLLYSNRGELVPDELTIQIVGDDIAARVSRGCYDPRGDLLVLDGIPRNVNQARLMDPLIDVLLVIHLTCKDPTPLIERLSKRAAKQGRPDDAREDVIRRRIEVYEQETAPMLAHYPADRVRRIDALGTPEQVHRAIMAQVEPVLVEQFGAVRASTTRE